MEWALAILFILICIVVFKIIQVNNECTANPFIYGAKNLEKQGVNVICSCENEHYKKLFWFDSNKIELIKEEQVLFHNIKANVINKAPN